VTPLGIVLLVLVTLAGLADIYTTKRAAIDQPERFHEGNPALRFLMNRVGPWVLVALKLGAVAFVGWALHYRPEWPVYLAAAFAVLLWGWAAWRNRRLIRKVRT
jgi:hypothetical protein